MLPVVDKPVVQYVVEELVRAGITRVLFVTGRRKRAIEDHFDADPELATGPLIDPRGGLQILYTRQAHPAGLGDAVRYAEGFADGRGVLVALGDALIETPASAGPGIVPRLIEAFTNDDVAAAFAVATVPDEAVSRYGVAVGPFSSGPFEVDRVVEKPDPSAVASRTAIMGRYVLGPDVFAALRGVERDASGEVQLTAALQHVIDAGRRVVAVPLASGERRHDVGSIQSYCEVFMEYALRDSRVGPALRARAAELIGDEHR
jgi:UTP--glucose-1-phosphate uridylyltransferase